MPTKAAVSPGTSLEGGARHCTTSIYIYIYVLGGSRQFPLLFGLLVSSGSFHFNPLKVKLLAGDLKAAQYTYIYIYV